MTVSQSLDIATVCRGDLESTATLNFGKVAWSIRMIARLPHTRGLAWLPAGRTPYAHKRQRH